MEKSNRLSFVDWDNISFFGLPFFQVSKVVHHQGQNLGFKIKEKKKLLFVMKYYGIIYV